MDYRRIFTKYNETSSKQTELTIVEDESLAVAVEKTERSMIEHAMLQTENNISKAAKLLDVPRQTLQYKLKKYHIGLL